MLCELFLIKQVLHGGVLILVLMEDALRAPLFNQAGSPWRGLNPCSNGRCSASMSELTSKIRKLMS